MTKNTKDTLERIKALLGFKRLSFASTFLVDGETEITNNKESDFEVGDELFIVGESTLTPAPEGSHTTREGLVITVDESSIIISIASEQIEEEMEEDEEVIEDVVEEIAEDIIESHPEISDEIKEEIVEEIVEALTPIIEEIKVITEELKKMKSKMSKMSSDFDKFKKSPEKFSVVEKKTPKENFLDYKVDLIKSFNNR